LTEIKDSDPFPGAKKQLRGRRVVQAILRGSKGTPPPWPGLLKALLTRAEDDSTWLAFHLGKRVEALTWRQAVVRAQGWACALSAAGVREGSRAALFLPNCPDYVGAFFGAQWLGATPVPLPWPGAEAGVPALPEGAQRTLDVADVAILAAPAGLAAAQRVVSGPATGDAVVAQRSAAPAFIQFTSGSTGMPRGAVISNDAAAASAWAMAQALELGPSDTGVSWLPFFHDMGLVGVLMASLAAGMPVHLLRPAEFLLRPTRWMELASEVRATITVGPNFGYELAARRFRNAEGLDLSGLRFALNGSEPVLRRTLEGFERRYASAGLKPGTVLPVYGLAENTLGVAFQATGRPGRDLPLGNRQIPSVGAPLPGTEIAIRAASGEVQEVGSEGEITVRGPSVMNGYFRDGEATLRTLRNGWLWTGDRGVVSDGRLYLTGRDKELVIKAGRKYHPADIERIVAEAVDAPPNGVAAFSELSEGDRGERLVVVVELRRRFAEDLQTKIRARLAEELGVTADRIELVGTGDLPRTTSGKLKRYECIARYGGGA
jgi:fatty-acyl-CoA synthase